MRRAGRHIGALSAPSNRAGPRYGFVEFEKPEQAEEVCHTDGLAGRSS